MSNITISIQKVGTAVRPGQKALVSIRKDVLRGLREIFGVSGAPANELADKLYHTAAKDTHTHYWVEAERRRDALKQIYQLLSNKGIKPTSDEGTFLGKCVVTPLLDRSIRTGMYEFTGFSALYYHPESIFESGRYFKPVVEYLDGLLRNR